MTALKKLVQSECLKIFARKSTQVMMAALLAAVLLAVIFDRFYSSYDVNYWGAVAGQAGLVFLITIFTIVAAGGSVANEFTWGTIKLLLIHPFSRGKILLSKYLAILLFMVVLFLTLLLSSIFLNGLLFIAGKGQSGSPGGTEGTIVFYYTFHKVIYLYLLMFLEVLVYGSIAFALSVISKSNAFSIGTTFFTMILGPQIANVISEKSWSKYFLFSHTQLTRFVKPNPLDPGGMGLWYSLVIIGCYLAIFYAVSWALFTKKDILK